MLFGTDLNQGEKRTVSKPEIQTEQLLRQLRVRTGSWELKLEPLARERPNEERVRRSFVTHQGWLVVPVSHRGYTRGDGWSSARRKRIGTRRRQRAYASGGLPGVASFQDAC